MFHGPKSSPDAWLVFNPEVSDGIRDFEVGSEVIVLTWLPVLPGLGDG